MLNMRVEIKKTLISDNNKRFCIGNDIAFTVLNHDANKIDNYIGNIKEIKDDSIILNNVEVNRCRELDDIEIKFDAIQKNSCKYVYTD